MKYQHFQDIPEVANLMQDADHVDIKTCEGELGLREYVVNFLSYQPPWVTFLYGVRFFFVRLLGMRQEGLPTPPEILSADLPMQKGEPIAFFTVETAREDHFWIASAKDSHLIAYLGVVVEPIAENRNRFYVLTIVRYLNWAGPVYFNVIRPFHHLVVGQMTKAGLQ